jgi:hypothetical protein
LKNWKQWSRRKHQINASKNNGGRTILISNDTKLKVKSTNLDKKTGAMINITTHEENALNECSDPQGDKHAR